MLARRRRGPRACPAPRGCAAAPLPPAKLRPVLRRATPDDLALVVELVAEFSEVDRHPFDRERVRDALVPLLGSDDHGVVWIVDVEGSVSGYAVVTWGYSIESGGVEGLVDELYVRERNRGLGGRVLDEVLDRCRSRGVRRMFLETESHNADARRFYARHGFEADDSIWMSRVL